MRRIGVLVCCLILCGLFSTHSATAQGEKPAGERDGGISKLVGSWTGESVCVNREKFPACKDEHVVYHIAAASGKPDTVTITMDKIVNGKPETMGVTDFVYDARKRMLTSEFKNERVHLILEFAVKGEIMDGAFSTLPERTPVRRIKVKKDE